MTEPASSNSPAPRPRLLLRWDRILFVLFIMIVTAGITALLLNIFERKQEAKNPYIRYVEVTDDTTDPAPWGINCAREYDTYKNTAEPTQTKFGGHGGSE